MTTITDVAAGVIFREGDHGPEFLLAQRPPGKAYAGYWEFPGGKVEAGESVREALDRELQEELGIVVEQAWPWITREFIYPHAHVRLKFFHVHAWHGEIRPLEHTGAVWTRLGAAPAVSPVLPANGPILRGLELPHVYALTNAAENGVEAEMRRLEKAMQGGLRLIQLRDKTLPTPVRAQLARQVMTLAGRFPGSTVLINDDESLAGDVGAHGLHLSANTLMQTKTRPAFARVAASCHTSAELAHAAALDLDFALLSPVLPTPSHPDQAGIGWEAFACAIEHAALPVFALGGMTVDLLDTARRHGAHGIALLRGWD